MRGRNRVSSPTESDWSFGTESMHKLLRFPSSIFTSFIPNYNKGEGTVLTLLDINFSSFHDLCKSRPNTVDGRNGELSVLVLISGRRVLRPIFPVFDGIVSTRRVSSNEKCL